MAVGDIIKLELESIAPGADALGRIEGKPVFVEGGAPCETVHCRITEEKKTWARAEILEIITPSPVRVKPVCSFYTQCGGCNLQHIDYNAQLELKVSILRDSFQRIGGVSPPETEIIPCTPFEYRNRMQFHCLRYEGNQNTRITADLREFARNKDSLNTGIHKFGFMGTRSKEIIPITDCPIAVPEIREFLRGQCTIPLPVEKDRFNVFVKDDVLLNEGGLQKGKIKILDKEIFTDASLFFQSNCSMLEKLIIRLREIAENANFSLPMADLYCGVGTFALFLGEKFASVSLAEENKNAVALARENLRGTNAEYYALRDTEWQRALFCRKRSFSFAVIDPPRAGLNSKLAQTLADNGPPLLAYVSCDAASLSRDTKVFLNGGYALKELKLFDFYPQTAHIESLAVFER